MHLHDIGDKVTYGESTADVKEVAFLGDDNQPTYYGKGTLHYFIEFPTSAVQHRMWVPASEVMGLPTVKLMLPAIDSNREEFFEQDDRSPDILEKGYSMLAWSDGLEARPDNSNLPPIVTLLMAIQYDKEGSYGSSWKGKGEYRGIMSNIDRKYDRLDKMTDDEIEGSIATLNLLEQGLEVGRLTEEEVGESKIDAIADLANYCLLYLTYVKEKYPRVFNIWVKKNVPAYLADKIPFI